MCMCFPVIDPVATGANIAQLRKERGLTVRDLQDFFGFEEPRAIYKWQRGQCLPSVDNLYALGAILDVSLDEILVPVRQHLNTVSAERQAESCRSAAFLARLDNSMPFLMCHGTVGTHLGDKSNLFFAG